MSKQIVMNILSDRPVAYHPDLARACGGVKAAIFLSQLLYWTDKGKRADGFIYKTQAEIEQETGLSKYEQRTARKALKGCGVLAEKQVGVPPILHYRIDTDVLYELLADLYAERSDLNVDNIHNYKRITTANIPESTAETTGTTACSDEPADNNEAPDKPKSYSELSKQRQAQVMFTFLAETCSIDLDTCSKEQRGALNQSEKILRGAGARPREIRAFREWWDAHDWRGKKGDPPKPHQIREAWGIYRNWASKRHQPDGWHDITAERLAREADARAT